MIILLSLIVIICPFHRYILYEDTHRWWSLFYRTDTRADSILWGALLAHIWIRGKEPKRGIVRCWLGGCRVLLACLPFATQERTICLLGRLHRDRFRVRRSDPGHSRWTMGGSTPLRTQAFRRSWTRLLCVLPLASARVLCRSILRPTLERCRTSCCRYSGHSFTYDLVVVCLERPLMKWSGRLEAKTVREAGVSPSASSESTLAPTSTGE